MRRTIFILGIDGHGRTGAPEEELMEILRTAEAVVGSSRQVSLLEARIPGRLPTVINWTAGIDEIVNEINSRSGQILVLASGDPGYFGIVRLLKNSFPESRFKIFPAPSSVSLAFAEAETSWEDATVISAHGRSYKRVIAELLRAIDPRNPVRKLAVLCSPENPPQAIAQLLDDAHAEFDRYLVCSDLGANTESVVEAPIANIARSEFAPLSIFLAIRHDSTNEPSVSTLPPSKSSSDFLHQRGMITKPEVREVILSKLLPHLEAKSPCLWDLGAGSGSVGLTALERIPAIRLFLVDRDPMQTRILRLNSSRFPSATVVQGEIQDSIWNLPDPNAVFIGGGGTRVLNALKSRLSQPTFVLASFAAIDRVTQAADLLGSMMEIMLPVGKRLPDGSWRLEGDNPVFISWGLLE